MLGHPLIVMKCELGEGLGGVFCKSRTDSQRGGSTLQKGSQIKRLCGLQLDVAGRMRLRVDISQDVTVRLESYSSDLARFCPTRCQQIKNWTRLDFTVLFLGLDLTLIPLQSNPNALYGMQLQHIDER